MALRDYLTSEVAEDWLDGLISRREALRRLALLGLSGPAAASLLAACADSGRQSAQPGTTRRSSPLPPGSAGSNSVPPAGSAEGEPITFRGPRGDVYGFFVAA
ncbi:MAG: dienelactone hydrolase family protein, partial [Chloroflexota bacterium]|nr:dienelactone hydrolase family protein [Chloroflexota bacterium]